MSVLNWMSAIEIPLLLESRAFLLQYWPRKAMKTATKDSSIVLANAAVKMEAAGGEMEPPVMIDVP